MWIGLLRIHEINLRKSQFSGIKIAIVYRRTISQGEWLIATLIIWEYCSQYEIGVRGNHVCFVKKPASRHKPYKYNEMFIRSERRYTYITNCTKGFIITEITGLYSLLWRVVRLNNNPG